MGKSSSKTGIRPATAEDLGQQLALRRQLGQLEVPLLQRGGNSNEYLFFVLLDGTGQDFNNPKLGLPTTIGLLQEQALRLASDAENRIGFHYSEGIGTQQNALARAVDGMLAHSWRDGIERAYRALSEKAEVWLEQHPDAEVRVAGAGYSRGAVQTAILLRMIDRYGIAHPEGLDFGRDTDGSICVISKFAPLVSPGKVAQAALLLDPVATNMPDDQDLRLPPSTLSGLAVLASHEKRPAFPHLAVIAPGMRPDQRALNVAAPGGHSNVGGGNRQDGMEIVTGNAAIDYLNSLRDTPLFEKRPLPSDVAEMTVHQSGGITAGYGLYMDRDDERNLRETLANCQVVDPCRKSEPVDEALAARFEFRQVQIDINEMAHLQGLADQAAERDAKREVAAPALPGPDRDPEAVPVAGFDRRPQERLLSTGDPDLDRLAAALYANDDEAFDRAVFQIGQSEEVQAMLQWGRDQVAAEERQLLQQVQQREQQEALEQQHAPVMRR